MFTIDNVTLAPLADIVVGCFIYCTFRLQRPSKSFREGIYLYWAVNRGRFTGARRWPREFREIRQGIFSRGNDAFPTTNTTAFRPL